MKKSVESLTEKKISFPVQQTLAVSDIVRDPANRAISEQDEDFMTLVDSVRVLGVLQPPHVHKLEDGTYMLIDGERRWRAARATGRAEISCLVWSDANGEDEKKRVVAGLVLNQERKAHSCLHIARRLRDIRNAYDFTGEELAEHVGMPVDRVKTYLALFAASDFLLNFFEEADLPVKVAAEFMRYEKTAKEAKARQLVERFKKSPMSRHEIVACRKRFEEAKEDQKEEKAAVVEASAPAHPLPAKVKAAILRDRTRMIPALNDELRSIGFELVPVDQRQSASV